jgi:hypothetical protein
MTDQVEVAGAFKVVQDAQGVRYEKQPEVLVDPSRHAYVEPPAAKSRRELEMEAGKRRVAEITKQLANHPPVKRSEAELRAQGTSTPVFRPNGMGLDRLQSGLGPLMRKVKQQGAPPPTTEG